MILKVKFTSAYKKSYKLMKKRGLDLSLLEDVINTLRQGKALEEKYHDHELKGKEKHGSQKTTDNTSADNDITDGYPKGAKSIYMTWL